MQQASATRRASCGSGPRGGGAAPTRSHALVAQRRAARPARRCPPLGAGVDKGFSLLEWSSKLAPQGALVTGAALGRAQIWRRGRQRSLLACSSSRAQRFPGLYISR